MNSETYTHNVTSTQSSGALRLTETTLHSTQSLPLEFSTVTPPRVEQSRKSATCRLTLGFQEPMNMLEFSPRTMLNTIPFLKPQTTDH